MRLMAISSDAPAILVEVGLPPTRSTSASRQQARRQPRPAPGRAVFQIWATQATTVESRSGAGRNACNPRAASGLRSHLR